MLEIIESLLRAKEENPEISQFTVSNGSVESILPLREKESLILRRYVEKLKKESSRLGKDSDVQ